MSNTKTEKRLEHQLLDGVGNASVIYYQPEGYFNPLWERYMSAVDSLKIMIGDKVIELKGEQIVALRKFLNIIS